MNNAFPASLAQLAGQSPILLVYLIGMALAVMYWRRSPLPCLLTLIATGFLFLVAVTQTLVTQYLIQSRLDSEWDGEHLNQVMMIVGVFGSCLRAVGLGLLIAAVFVKRGPVAPTVPSPAV